MCKQVSKSLVLLAYLHLIIQKLLSTRRLQEGNMDIMALFDGYDIFLSSCNNRGMGVTQASGRRQASVALRLCEWPC